jgi:hypothetical protein
VREREREREEANWILHNCNGSFQRRSNVIYSMKPEGRLTDLSKWQELGHKGLA